MKKPNALIATILLCAFYFSASLPFAHSAPYEISSLNKNLAVWATASPQTQTPAAPRLDRREIPSTAIKETAGTLMENVLAVLEKRYYDERFRKEMLPKLASQYAAKDDRAKTLREQRDVVQELLSHIPASHLGLLSKQTYRCVMDDLRGRPYPTFGFQLIEIKGKFYSFFVLEGGPAEQAGLLTWDRIVSIDGVAPEQSSRLDWRSDDAYISDDRDPPVHYLIAAHGDTTRIRIERSSNKFLNLTIAAENYSAFEAAKASARIHKVEGRSFGYLHLWYIHLTGVPELLKDKLEGEFKSCEGVILDMRGRGGNGVVISKIIDMLRADRSSRNRPIIALVDRQSRSAKDILAYEFKKTGVARVVGEPTAGAVIPATFADVGHDSILMFPSFKLPPYTDLLEFKPVEPDVLVERAGLLSAGVDPILKAGLAEALRLVKASAKRASAN